MSAYVVERDTITRAVKAILARRGDEPIIDQFAGYDTRAATAGRDIGRALWILNIEAYEWRYGTGEYGAALSEVARFDFGDFRPIGRVELIKCYKALQSLRYQCGEGSCTEGPLYHAMTEAVSALAQAIVDDLPEYQDARWGR